VAEEHGLFITTSDYSAGAYHEAVACGKTPIHLLTRQQLLSLLIEQGLLVQSIAVRVLEVVVEGAGSERGHKQARG
jgi:restriction endonuclease Mrr